MKKDPNEKNLARQVGLKHIAFIMDGNGRWATRQGKPREYGHAFGAKTFRNMLNWCDDFGVEFATFYAFSTENWKRPVKEVNEIMRLLDVYLDQCEKDLKKHQVRFIFIGDPSPLKESLQKKIRHIEEISSSYERIVNVALNYGGRAEIVRACKDLLAEGKTEVTEEDLSSRLYTRLSPDPDMIVRTGGDLRISNYLLWQAAYAELYFTDVLWPDFSKQDLKQALEEFGRRKRRFGGVEESSKKENAERGKPC